MAMNILSGNGMTTGQLINQLQDNITFRVTSARDMLTGLTGESEMSPLQRRREIRDRRLTLVGLGGDADMSSHAGGGNGGSDDASMSGQISDPMDHTRPAENETVSDNVPSMDEVDAGTRGRAQDSGFSEPN